jgi:hypothetical protein
MKLMPSHRFALSLGLVLLPVILVTLYYVGTYEREIRTFPDRWTVITSEPIRSKLAYLKIQVPIVAAGDSRAEMQLIPAVLRAETSLEAVNLATTAGDIGDFERAAHSSGLLGQGRLFILSISFFQVNDGLMDDPYLSPSQVLSMSTFERFRLFKSRYPSSMRHYLGRFSEIRHRPAIPPALTPAIIAAAGVQVSTGHGAGDFPKAPWPERTRHPWYQSIQIDGIRWRLTVEAIRRLCRENPGDLFVVFNGSMSPNARAEIRGSLFEKAEQRFDANMAELMGHEPNGLFLNYYDPADQTLLDDSLFYDLQHLNAKGAEIFSRLIIRDLKTNPKTKDWFVRNVPGVTRAGEVVTLKP